MLPVPCHLCIPQDITLAGSSTAQLLHAYSHKCRTIFWCCIISVHESIHPVHRCMQVLLEQLSHSIKALPHQLQWDTSHASKSLLPQPWLRRQPLSQPVSLAWSPVGARPGSYTIPSPSAGRELDWHGSTSELGDETHAAPCDTRDSTVNLIQLFIKCLSYR